MRHAITKLSHIHFPATEKSKSRIIKMGENSKFVYNTGCPSIDLIKNTPVRNNRYHINQNGVRFIYIMISQTFLLVVQHPGDIRIWKRFQTNTAYIKGYR